jgi:hypothetical protein
VSVRQVTGQLPPATATDDQSWQTALRCNIAQRVLQACDNFTHSAQLTEKQTGHNGILSVATWY